MFVQDLRYAFRSMRHNPGFTAAGIAILALAIAATTAVFSVVNASLLRALPYADPSHLTSLSLLWPNTTREGPVSLHEVEFWREQARAFTGVGSFVFTELPVKAGATSYSVVTAAVDPELLRTLGTPLMLGGNFSGSGSTHPDTSAIISFRFWRDALGADRNAIGKTLTVNGSPFSIAGVLPASFQFPRADASFYDNDVDLLIPVVNIADQWGRDTSQWFAIGRLRDGANLAQAQAELSAIDSRVSRPQSSPAPAIRVASLSDVTTHTVRPALLLIFGISVVLLLIACVNVMSLWFSRAAARSRELAIRKAIGASFARVLRQMVTESACLTFSAGLAGVMLARVFQRALVDLSPFHVPLSGTIDIDWRVITFAACVCALAAVVSGVLPAFYSNLDGDSLLGGTGTRVSSTRRFVRVQRALSIGQIALGVALLTAAGLLVNSLWRLSEVDPGFRSHGVVGFTFTVPADHPRNQNSALYERLLTSIAALPGVQAVGLVNYLPPEQRKGVFVPVTIEGETPDSSSGRSFCNFAMANDDYFKTLGIPIVSGRAFTKADSETSAPVGIANDAFVRRYLRQRPALGRLVKTPFADRPYEIVGVLGPMRDRGLGVGSVPALYVPFKQFAFGYGSIAVRSTVPASALVPAIRARAAQIDASIPLQNFETLDERIRSSLGEPRFYTVLASSCAGLAVLFVALGLYGLMAYSVSRRTPEIGIRMAVGAQPAAILRMVLRQGLGVGIVGAAIGAAISLWLTRLLRGLLFHVTPADPLTFAAAISMVMLITLLASYLPARRASRVDPIVALRHD